MSHVMSHQDNFIKWFVPLLVLVGMVCIIAYGTTSPTQSQYETEQLEEIESWRYINVKQWHKEMALVPEFNDQLAIALSDNIISNGEYFELLDIVVAHDKIENDKLTEHIKQQLSESMSITFE
jgi:hypothetical protein